MELAQKEEVIQEKDIEEKGIEKGQVNPDLNDEMEASGPAEEILQPDKPQKAQMKAVVSVLYSKKLANKDLGSSNHAIEKKRQTQILKSKGSQDGQSSFFSNKLGHSAKKKKLPGGDSSKILLAESGKKSQLGLEGLSSISEQHSDSRRLEELAGCAADGDEELRSDLSDGN